MLYDLWEPRLSYTHEDWMTFHGGVGLTPTRGPLSPQPIWDAGFLLSLPIFHTWPSPVL
ncbi:MAG: hypothetical protein ACP5J5_02485 [Dissulfurimicrobium sp.]|uniref:hypothetical protein n=1 Tax=Dissulfurimicrobium hydrothermale TaxID=1750598 RepID=UPI001EDA870A|nr:hypothetical protein [Dissulfurimicrobium hydrothermale]UKL12996.1 hypothetical protein LGS26_05725 [Dissulfurimicrobium hydrothermale]